MRWQQFAAILLIAAGTVSAAGPAKAQLQTGQRYEGLYVGAEAGIGTLDLDDALSLGELEDTAFAYGGFVGWRTKLPGGFVLGLEGRAMDSDAADRFDGVVVAADGRFSSVQLGRSLGVDAVAGMTFGREESTLLFVSGGFLNTKVKGNRLRTDGVGIEINLPTSQSESGYRIGGGLEMTLWENIGLRATGHFADTGPVDQIQALGSLIFDF